ncbi:myotrophin [Hippocampus comes]|uniref:Myotrophin n=1 Tax=Hippocampus comes TaxID=109280 RepID=A0A3Q2XZJ4_HIPCM|nr:PREDICTED: myotrophin [Hippocampus comes]
MGDTNLTWAVKTGDMEVVENNLKTTEDVNRTLDNGRKPLHIACDFGQTCMVEFLVSKGADINAIDKHGLSPLFYASLEGHVACVKFLLEKGADKHLQGPNGKTVIEMVSDDAIKALFK